MQHSDKKCWATPLIPTISVKFRGFRRRWRFGILQILFPPVASVCSALGGDGHGYGWRFRARFSFCNSPVSCGHIGFGRLCAALVLRHFFHLDARLVAVHSRLGELTDDRFLWCRAFRVITEIVFFRFASLGFWAVFAAAFRIVFWLTASQLFVARLAARLICFQDVANFLKVASLNSSKQ